MGMAVAAVPGGGRLHGLDCIRRCRARATKLFEDSIVRDPPLMWTRTDNLEDVNWTQANQYCQDLTLGDYSDWRLPTIEELEKLYDPKSGTRFNIRKPFRLTSYCVWSSTKEGSDSAWDFDFGGGERFRILLDDSVPPSGPVCASFRRMMGHLVIGSFSKIFAD